MHPLNGQQSYPASASQRRRKQLPSYLLSYAEMLAEDFRTMQKYEGRDAHDYGDRITLLGNGVHRSIPRKIVNPNLKKRIFREL